MSTMPRRNDPPPRTRNANHWSRDDIEAARNADLAPILARNGYLITPLPNGAMLLHGFRGLIIHANRWTWKAERLFGNTLDFFVTLEGKTFAQAMEIVNAANDDSDDLTDDLTDENNSCF